MISLSLYIYIYIHINVYIYIYIYMYIHVYVGEPRYGWAGDTGVCEQKNTGRFGWHYLYIYIYIYMYIYIYIYVYVFIFIDMCVYIHVHIYRHSDILSNGRVEWHYSSNAACLIRPRLFYVFMRFPSCQVS